MNSTSDLLSEKEELIAQLKSENLFLRKILALIPGNVFWKDKEGKFLGCNNQVAKILGYSSPEEIIGKSNKELFDAHLAQLADKVDCEIQESGETQYLEEHGLDIHKQPAIYLTQKQALRDENNTIIGLLGVSFDITERKKIEEEFQIAKKKAEASTRAKSQFLAVVNHELRTPLASIIGLIDFLKQGALSPEEEKNIINTIGGCTQHLLNLVNDVLDFTQLEAEKYSLHISKVNLHEIVQNVFLLLKGMSDSKGLQLLFEANDILQHYILTDARIVRQILINLVANAIKFTDQGNITIKATGIPITKNKVKLTLAVIDCGVGVPADKLDIIFEPFRQLEDPYTRHSSRSGTGLGLTIVKNLTKLIGAKIQVKSEIGKGSEFALIGEFEVSPIKTRKKNISPQPEGEKNAKNCTPIYPNHLTYSPSVLLVEDDPVVQFVHSKMLRNLGCVVTTTATGQDAIQKSTAKFDIIFVDISLPDVNGFEVIKSMRQFNKKASTPIVALTAYTGKEEKIKALDAGANVFTSKPISQNYLKKLLLKYIKAY